MKLLISVFTGPAGRSGMQSETRLVRVVEDVQPQFCLADAVVEHAAVLLVDDDDTIIYNAGSVSSDSTRTVEDLLISASYV